jgi:hypothetical protein
MPPQRAGIAAFWCETWQRDLTRPENRQIAGDLEGGLVPLPTAGPISREVFSLSFLLDAAERRIYPPLVCAQLALRLRPALATPVVANCASKVWGRWPTTCAHFITAYRTQPESLADELVKCLLILCGS